MRLSTKITGAGARAKEWAIPLEQHTRISPSIGVGVLEKLRPGFLKKHTVRVLETMKMPSNVPRRMAVEQNLNLDIVKCAGPPKSKKRILVTQERRNGKNPLCDFFEPNGNVRPPLCVPKKKVEFGRIAGP